MSDPCPICFRKSSTWAVLECCEKKLCIKCMSKLENEVKCPHCRQKITIRREEREVTSVGCGGLTTKQDLCVFFTLTVFLFYSFYVLAVLYTFYTFDIEHNNTLEFFNLVALVAEAVLIWIPMLFFYLMIFDPNVNYFKEMYKIAVVSFIFSLIRFIIVCIFFILEILQKSPINDKYVILALMYGVYALICIAIFLFGCIYLVKRSICVTTIRTEIAGFSVTPV